MKNSFYPFGNQGPLKDTCLLSMHYVHKLHKRFRVTPCGLKLLSYAFWFCVEFWQGLHFSFGQNPGLGLGSIPNEEEILEVLLLGEAPPPFQRHTKSLNHFLNFPPLEIAAFLTDAVWESSSPSEKRIRSGLFCCQILCITAAVLGSRSVPKGYTQGPFPYKGILKMLQR